MVTGWNTTSLGPVYLSSVGGVYRCIYHYIRFDALNLIMEECTEAVRQSSRVSVVWKY